MRTLQQKTENSSRNQHKSSVENASSNSSESVLCSPGKDASQEPHNELIHCILQIPSKANIQGDLWASWKSQAQNKKTTELSCCYSWASAIFLSATIKALAQKTFQPSDRVLLLHLSKVKISTMVTRTCQMAKRAGQIKHLIFWLDRKKAAAAQSYNLI